MSPRNVLAPGAYVDDEKCTVQFTLDTVGKVEEQKIENQLVIQHMLLIIPLAQRLSS